ncbi:MAG: hypothetical protein CML19_11565 [Pusillimonas sp.]|nr:hypothetical protein [Pusillimonas sp.]|tara:strand:+ start:154 stop:423 length:270 start_codon:yes stop_codon:yes gene_type:complete
MTDKKEFTVSILWGEFPEDIPKSYNFQSEEELEAFLLGVEETNGWMDYNAVVHTKGKDQKFTLEEFDLNVGNFTDAFLKEWAEYMEERD